MKRQYRGYNQYLDKPICIITVRSCKTTFVSVKPRQVEPSCFTLEFEFNFAISKTVILLILLL